MSYSVISHFFIVFWSQYYSRAVSPYGIFIVCTDRPVQAAWQQYRPIIPVSSAKTVSYNPRRVYLRRKHSDKGAVRFHVKIIFYSYFKRVLCLLRIMAKAYIRRSTTGWTGWAFYRPVFRDQRQKILKNCKIHACNCMIPL